MSNKLRKLSKEITLTPRRHHRKKAFILKEMRQNIMEQKIASGMSKENAELSALIATSPYKIDSKGVRQPLVDFSQLSSESQQVLLGVITKDLSIETQEFKEQPTFILDCENGIISNNNAAMVNS